ncbi:hypothetical protein [Rothia nasimurium]|uniref:hypothetical protein n=1 Tax=Rothia nasimurium TaxID=85336 RepID=UPI001F1605EC|nr:hypothetical protein [Rothia nasimurium]
MTVKKNYPEDIYPETATQTIDGPMYWISHRKDYERAYDLGFRDGRFKERLEASNPLAGWSNLTEAIKTGERIDWEKLDGLEAKCVHPDLGVLTYKLERDGSFPPAKYSAWYKTDCPSIWLEALIKSWLGRGGWSLWIKGELPLRKLTADQLEPGTCFRARYTGVHYTHTHLRAQIVQVGDKTHVACFSGSAPAVIIWRDPADIEVLEVYGVGTFPTPKENQ